MPVHWPTFLAISGGRRLNRFFENFFPTTTQFQEPRSGDKKSGFIPAGFVDQLKLAPGHKRSHILNQHIREMAAKVLGLESLDDLDDQQPLQELGLDSLMATELKNLLQSSIGLEQRLSATLVFDYPAIAQLTSHIMEKIPGLEMSAEKMIAVKKDQAQDEFSVTLDRIEQLSDEEVERLFDKDLDHGK